MRLHRHLRAPRAAAARAAVTAAALLAAALLAAAVLAPPAAPASASASGPASVQTAPAPSTDTPASVPTAPAPLASASANPSPAQIRTLLRAAAVAHDIPVKILYAIAWQESTWRQFDSTGAPLISADGGIGIMQVTSITPEMDVARLMTDVAYNIDVGASILDEKWGYAPSVFAVIGGGDRRCYEDWFFAIWAYNGLSRDNPYPYLIWGHIADGRGRWTGQPVTPVAKSRLVDGRPPKDLVVSTPQPEHWWSATPLPRPTLGTPRAQKRVGAGDRFTVSGTLSPRHPAGAHSVVVLASRWNGADWVLKRTLLTTDRDAGEVTRWAGSINLTQRGRWRLVAQALPDADHAQIDSRAAFVTVVR